MLTIDICLLYNQMIVVHCFNLRVFMVYFVWVFCCLFYRWWRGSQR